MIVSPCALVGVDLHRGHLDPAVATMPVPADQAAALLARTIPAFRARCRPHADNLFSGFDPVAAAPILRGMTASTKQAKRGENR